MKKDIRNKIVISGACIIVSICIAGFPRDMFSEESHSSQKTDVLKGIEKLEHIEGYDIYEIESEIQSVRNNMEAEQPHAAKETITEAQTEQITEPAPVEDTTTESVDKETQTILESGQSAYEAAQSGYETAQSEHEPEQREYELQQNGYEPEQNPVIEEPILNESNAADEYVMAGLDVNSYNYKEIFANSVVMGDSISEGLVSFNMLNSSSVIAKVGVSLTALDGALATVTQLSPQNVFLYYGLNDVGHVKYDYDRFRNEYESFVVRLKEALPNANIYANLLFPVNDWTLIGPWYDNLDPYNQVIIDVCMQYGIVCLDNRDIVREEYYASDGYHFNRAFYPQWLYRMAIGAGLIQ